MNSALAIAVLLSRARWTSNSPTESRQCRPGFFHNVTVDLCQVCPSGTYTDSYNLNSRCNQCSSCTGLHILVSACNTLRDTVCKCPDGYYEHDDGCSLKTVAHVEERSSKKHEWTWTEGLLIVTFIAVVILAILFVLHCLGKLPTSLQKCKKDQPSTGKRLEDVQNPVILSDLASKDQEKVNSHDKKPNQVNHPANSESPQVVRANGAAGSAASDSAKSTTPQEGGEALAAAGGGTGGPQSTSVARISAGGAELAGAQGGAAETKAQTAVQAYPESKPVITPQKELRRSKTDDAAASQEAVQLPFKTSPVGPATPDKREAAASSTLCCPGNDHRDDCSKCFETHDSLTGALSTEQCGLGLDHPDDGVNETQGLATAGTMGSMVESQHSITVDVHATERHLLLNEHDRK